jgi:hypothetical protein
MPAAMRCVPLIPAVYIAIIDGLTVKSAVENQEKGQRVGSGILFRLKTAKKAFPAEKSGPGKLCL